MAQDQRVDPVVLEPEADRFLLSCGWLATSDVHRVAGGAERQIKPAKGCIEQQRSRSGTGASRKVVSLRISMSAPPRPDAVMS